MFLATSIAVIIAIPFTAATSYPLRRSHVPSRGLVKAIHGGEPQWNHNPHMPSGPKKRQSTGSNTLTNYDRDANYYISAEFGTPPKSYYVILDTSCSEIWLASAECTAGCANFMNLYASGPNSSTYSSPGTAPFDIFVPYIDETIKLQGTVASDTVSLAGFTVPNQTFGVITSIHELYLPPNVTGIIGLGRPQPTQIGLPFWIRSSQLTPWAEPLFAFSFLRQDFIQRPAISTPGGTFSIGQLDRTAYQGSIEYTNVPTGLQSGWLIPLVQIGVGEQMFNISNGGNISLALFDTWRSMIGGPEDVVSRVYNQIPGARRGIDDDRQYWFYPCSVKVLLSFNFGGRTWPINPTDFVYTTRNLGTCQGALFAMVPSSPTEAQWAIGLPFLVNVYSIFRYDPPSIGFAANPGATISVPPATSTTVVSFTVTQIGTTHSATVSS